jgi:hypothetical protein
MSSRKLEVTEEKFRRFLSKLAEDNEFRRVLRKDPENTLRREGIPFDPDEVPEKIKLPPKAKLRGKVDQLVEQAMSSQAKPNVQFFLGGNSCAPKPRPEPKR